jgi:hypothetical protein
MSNGNNFAHAGSDRRLQPGLVITKRGHNHVQWARLPRFRHQVSPLGKYSSLFWRVGNSSLDWRVPLQKKMLNKKSANQPYHTLVEDLLYCTTGRKERSARCVFLDLTCNVIHLHQKFDNCCMSFQGSNVPCFPFYCISSHKWDRHISIQVSIFERDSLCTILLNMWSPSFLVWLLSRSVLSVRVSQFSEKGPPTQPPLILLTE